MDLRYDVFDSNQQQFQSGSGSSVLRLMTNNVAESITAPTTFNFTDIASGVPFGENHMNIQFSATSPRPGVDGRVLLGFLKL